MFYVNSPGGRRWAESDLVVGADTGEGTGFVIVSIAVSAWTGCLEQL